MKKIGIIIIVVTGFFLITSRIYNPETNLLTNEDTSMFPTNTLPQNITASFAIFTNGTLRTFNAPMYHSLSDDVYITSENPNRVIVKKTNTTWNDFFLTLPLSLTDECLTTGTGETFCNTDTKKLKFYINGMRDDNALSKEIKQADSLLVSFGPINDPQIPNQISQIPRF